MAFMEIRHLKKYFNTPAGKVHAVDDINISIPEGETLGVVGESGCGKSTLLNLLSGILPVTEGAVFF